MAELGFRTIKEMVGQADALGVRAVDPADWKQKDLDFSKILFKAPDNGLSLYQTEIQDHGLSEIIDHELIKAAKPALDSKEPVYAEFEVKNTNRAIGTMLSNEVSKVYKSQGLPQDTINFKFHGSAGQSFGAFA